MLSTTVLALASLTLYTCVNARHVADTRYYDLLGVPASASESQLRKAYHKLALQWHPDKQSQKSDGQKKEAEEKFKEISLAYDTLSDPEKRKLYDQVGEEGMKRGDRPGTHRTGGFDPFKIFEQFFKGFESGGGFSFKVHMGGGRGGPKSLFADHPEEIETLQDQNRLEEIISNSASNGGDAASYQSLAILCIETNGDCKGLKSGLVKIAKSYKGAVSFYAVDCMRSPMLCRRVEADVKRYPCLVYYGYQKRLPYPHEESLSVKGIRRWLASAVPENLVYLKSTSDQESFLAKDSRKPKVVYLMEKPGTPPRLKVVSMQFKESLGIGLLNKKDFPSVFASFMDRVAERASPGALPIFYNVQTHEFVKKAGEELHSYFTGLVSAFKASEVQSVTATTASEGTSAVFQEWSFDLYQNGVCNESEYRFCFLTVFPTEMDLKNSKISASFARVIEEFKQEESDPLHVLYIILESSRQSSWSQLNHLISAAGYSNSRSAGAFLWRPKWKRFEDFGGDLSNADELIKFTRSVLIRAAVHGSSGLSQEHQDL